MGESGGVGEQGGVGKESISVEASMAVSGMSFSETRVGSVGEKANVTFFLCRSDDWLDLRESGRECVESREFLRAVGCALLGLLESSEDWGEVNATEFREQDEDERWEKTESADEKILLVEDKDAFEAWV